MSARSPSPSAERPEERYVARWQQAWSHGREEPCLSEHAATIRDRETLYIQPLFDAVRGEEGMRAMFSRIFALVPDLRAELDNWTVGAGTAFIEFTLTGTLGGKPLSWRAVDRMALDGEKLVLRETYYDPLPVLVALITRPRAWLRVLGTRAVPRLRPRRTAPPPAQLSNLCGGVNLAGHRVPEEVLKS